MLTKRAVWMMGLFAVLAFGVCARAQERGGEWAYLGESYVDGSRDHDKIKVDRSPETFRAIQLRVEGGDVEFDRIKVRFKNGGAADRLMHVSIAAGGETRAIDLPGGRRIIKSVEIWYHKNSAGARPRVSLFGMR